MSTTIPGTRSLLFCLAALAMPACAGASSTAAPTRAPAQVAAPTAAQQAEAEQEQDAPDSAHAADVESDTEPAAVAEGEVTQVIEIGADAGPPPTVVSPPKRPPMPSMMSDVVMGPSR